jgi:hypothetical protein
MVFNNGVYTDNDGYSSYAFDTKSLTSGMIGG